MKLKSLLTLVLGLIISFGAIAQDKESLSKDNPSGQKNADANKEAVSKFDKFNQKAEKLFIYIPVPIVSYAQETGQVFGVAKFNMLYLYKDDTVTTPSKVSGLFTASTLGNIKVVASWKLFFKNDKYLHAGQYVYRVFPELIYGVGNNPNIENQEQITNHAWIVESSFASQFKKNHFLGGGWNFRQFMDVQYGEDSYLAREDVLGKDGGNVSGLSLFYIFDNRKNRYTPQQGTYLEVKSLWNMEWLGSDFRYLDFSIDARKYFPVFKNHVIATQAFFGTQSREVPFFDLYNIGGDSRMRGYYLGAIRDANIMDAQVEYRAPIWNIFGLTAWYGFGKVWPNQSEWNLKNIWQSYGAGLRIMVDSRSQTNLRFDVGFSEFGPSPSFIISFAEAF